MYWSSIPLRFSILNRWILTQIAKQIDSQRLSKCPIIRIQKLQHKIKNVCSFADKNSQNHSNSTFNWFCFRNQMIQCQLLLENPTIIGCRWSNLLKDELPVMTDFFLSSGSAIALRILLIYRSNTSYIIYIYRRNDREAIFSVWKKYCITAS